MVALTTKILTLTLTLILGISLGIGIRYLDVQAKIDYISQTNTTSPPLTVSPSIPTQNESCGG